MMPGSIADFQMWDRAFTDAEVEGLGCDAKGNLVTFDQFTIEGTQQKETDGDFVCQTP